MQAMSDYVYTVIDVLAIFILKGCRKKFPLFERKGGWGGTESFILSRGGGGGKTSPPPLPPFP